MAEGFLKHALAATDHNYCEVGSAGLGALVNHPPDEKIMSTYVTKSIDISSYRARQLDKDMIRKADLILVMESSHKTAIEEMEPSSKGKVSV